jgi:glycosyltransferase involved in cell wall biosynthesis
MKILVDCRCLNYPFLTGVNAYTIRLLHSLSSIKSANPEIKLVAMGLKNTRLRDLMNRFPFLFGLFEEHISLAQYLNYQDYSITQNSWFHKFLEVKLIAQNWFYTNLNNDKIEKYDFILLPQPRLLGLNSQSKLITIFHDIFSILDKQKQLPQSLIFNKKTCQTLINRSYKIIAGSISTCKDINKTFFNQTNFINPKIQLIYPALPNLQELQIFENSRVQVLGTQSHKSDIDRLPLDKGKVKQGILAMYCPKEMAAQADRGYQNDDTQTKELKIKTQPYILAISGIEPRKNWHNLLLAHKYLQEKYNWNITLILSGSTINQKYCNKLLQIIERHKIKNIIWQINVSELEKNELIKNCEFVVYPSYYEGFGFPILEAFEHGKVVVTSRISSMPEIGKNSCIYANPFSFVSIANCIYLLRADLKLRQNLESNIKKTRKHYSWIEMKNTLEKILI